MAPPRAELTGQRFGRWLVLRYSHASKGGKSYWLCRCDCGTEATTASTYLLHGQSKQCRSCRDRHRIKCITKHGQSESRNQKATPEYVAWTAMIHRCERPSYRGYHRYGGRGIKVCERWRNSFKDFLADVGQRPSPTYSIDRYPNNDGDYKPGNVRWATKREQSLNRQNPWIARREKNGV